MEDTAYSDLLPLNITTSTTSDPFASNTTLDEDPNDGFMDEYEYDLEMAMSFFDWSELVPTLAVYTVTMVLGVTGNALIIFTTARYRRMKSTTNVFLCSLACADLLLLLICIPVKVAKLFSYSWTMGAFMCKLVHYLQSVSAVCSVLTLTAMSLERYYAIVHPMRAKYICTISQAKRIIAAIWIASFLLAVPMIFVQVQVLVGERVKAYWCVPDDSQPLLWRSHELYMLLLILVVPAGIMALAYSAICWEVWRVVQRRHHMTSGRTLADGQLKRPSSQGQSRGRHQDLRRPLEDDNSTVKQSVRERYSLWKRVIAASCELTPDADSDAQRILWCFQGVRGDRRAERGRRPSRKKRAEGARIVIKKVIKMLVAVVVLFVACWAPLLVFNVLRAYGVIPANAPGAPKHVATVFHLMAYFNSCINPMVYGFMSRNFRESFRKALCRCWGRRRRGFPSRYPSLSQSRTTSVRCHTVSMTMAGLTVHNGQGSAAAMGVGGGGATSAAAAPTQAETALLA